MISINLIPLPLQLARVRRERIRLWCMGIGALILVMAIPITSDLLQRSRLGVLEQDQSALILQLDAQRGDLKSTVLESEAAKLRIERASRLKSKRAWSGLLAAVARAMPEDCWLTSVATDPVSPRGPQSRPAAAPQPGAQPTKSESAEIESPTKIRLMGYAIDGGSVHTFARRLREQGPFVNVSIAQGSREATLDGMYYRFQMDCEW